MAGIVEIPRITDFDNLVGVPGKPGWYCPTQDGKSLKPVIRCNCGQLCGIGLHHVHADGTVTASFFHHRGTDYRVGDDPNGCEWHVFIKLKDYDQGDFPPRVKTP
jgi:hypothetical protein